MSNGGGFYEVEMEETSFATTHNDSANINNNNNNINATKTLFSFCNDNQIKEKLEVDFDWKALERGRLVSPTD